jgi:hypothetical protein
MSRYKKAAFATLIVAGIGFGIGAAFVPPLIALSTICLAGAVAVLRVEPREARPEALARPVAPDNDNPRSDSSGENLEVDLHIHGARMHHHPRRSVHSLNEVDNKSDRDYSAASRKPRK